MKYSWHHHHIFWGVGSISPSFLLSKKIYSFSLACSNSYSTTPVWLGWTEFRVHGWINLTDLTDNSEGPHPPPRKDRYRPQTPPTKVHYLATIPLELQWNPVPNPGAGPPKQTQGQHHSRTTLNALSNHNSITATIAGIIFTQWTHYIKQTQAGSQSKLKLCVWTWREGAL